MFVLYKTIETADGRLDTLVHGVYDRQADAQQIGDNLRLLYDWVKATRVELQSEPPESQLPMSRKKMAGSIVPDVELPQRKIS